MMPSKNETEDEKFERVWGHKPFWEDKEGFEERVKLVEIHGYSKGMELFKEATKKEAKHDST